MLKKKILITGSQGFIGSNLLRLLLPENRIIGINNKSDTKRKNYTPITKDIRKTSSRDIKGHIDGIIHLAAITDVDFCNKFPLQCYETNVMGTLNILELARKKDCKLVFVSTSHVYGNPIKLPIREDFPRNPTSIYATSKLEGEITCEGYARSYGLDIGIVRLFSVYGKNCPPHLVISRIISQLEKKSIKLGNLQTKRDFIYIDDAIRAIKLVFLKSQGLNAYNVGTGKSFSILEICNMIKKFSNKKTLVESVEKYKRNVEINEIRADISKIRKLGWKPSIPIDKGIKLLLEEVGQLYTLL